MKVMKYTSYKSSKKKFRIAMAIRHTISEGSRVKQN